MAVVRSRLLQQRKPLQYTFNGFDLIPRAQQTTVGTVDAKNGPQPQSCNIIYLTNNTFLVRYHIIAHYWENNDVTPDPGDEDTPLVVNQPGNNVLTNRWSETCDIDNANFMTRTREGKYIIRSDNTSGVIADMIRSAMCQLQCPAGFLRINSHYKVSPDGLAMEYRITDKEQFKMPPSPAYEAQGEYLETTTMNGAYRVGLCRVRLKGDRNTLQVQLVNTAIQVVATKLAVRGVQVGGGVNPRVGFTCCLESSCRIDMYQNIVEVSAKGIIAVDTAFLGLRAGRNQALAGFVGMDTRTPGSDFINYQPAYPVYGIGQKELGYLIKAAAYWDPSLRGNNIDPRTGQPRTGAEVGTVGAQGE